MYFSAAVAVEYDNFGEPVAFIYLQCDNATKKSSRPRAYVRVPTFEGCTDISTDISTSSLLVSGCLNAGGVICKGNHTQ